MSGAGATEADALAGEAGRQALLRAIAAAGDAPVAIAEAALALAAADRPRVALDRYRRHLRALAAEIADAARDARGLAGRAAALNAVLHERYGYDGDETNYDDLQNANLMRVIDRRKGLPVALGILYMHGARAQGWEICGIAFPGHFLLQLSGFGERAILDPFHRGRLCAAADLRELLKAMSGAEAELTPQHYAPVADREVLLRLQNNIKLRLIQSRQIAKALAILDGMLLFAPDHAALWREAALLRAHLGNYRAAIAALEEFLAREAAPAARHQAARLLQQFKTRLN
ncbi:MAG TPA: transglutaminase-like domain-containing protein [Stellaceae bacterium]|nr:transglutaminase-like domain-containing protein [Stellaceae bacterium]